MVLSRIILTALLALGSIAVALPVVPGGVAVAGTTPTPRSGAVLPRMDDDNSRKDLENNMKKLSISPLVGGPSSPNENAVGSSSNASPPGHHFSSSEVPSKEFPTQVYKKAMRQKIELIQNFPNVPDDYKKIADRLSDHLDIEKPSMVVFYCVAQDSMDVHTLAHVIEKYVKPQPDEGKDPKIEELRRAFKQGEFPATLLAILNKSPEPGTHR
ncbi:hypothetical protein F5876DRAFT_76442 [Lentinula aff. lateritia]|uniref:Uncharacterized protein n=1 Tax=Lentinula aff. lateritia TaxID=2804960 RepID=A0ACC1U1J5_9AGAR|nr:hypothetical protein F5876DRAFT_76442 [Lentinula aff. lateritia]